MNEFELIIVFLEILLLVAIIFSFVFLQKRLRRWHEIFLLRQRENLVRLELRLTSDSLRSEAECKKELTQIRETLEDMD